MSRTPLKGTGDHTARCEFLVEVQREVPPALAELAALVPRAADGHLSAATVADVHAWGVQWHFWVASRPNWLFAVACKTLTWWATRLSHVPATELPRRGFKFPTWGGMVDPRAWDRWSRAKRAPGGPMGTWTGAPPADVAFPVAPGQRLTELHQRVDVRVRDKRLLGDAVALLPSGIKSHHWAAFVGWQVLGENATAAALRWQRHAGTKPAPQTIRASMESLRLRLELPQRPSRRGRPRLAD